MVILMADFELVFTTSTITVLITSKSKAEFIYW